MYLELAADHIGQHPAVSFQDSCRSVIAGTFYGKYEHRNDSIYILFYIRKPEVVRRKLSD
jgi:hypothetical protein